MSPEAAFALLAYIGNLLASLNQAQAEITRLREQLGEP